MSNPLIKTINNGNNDKYVHAKTTKKAKPKTSTAIIQNVMDNLKTSSNKKTKEDVGNLFSVIENSFSTTNSIDDEYLSAVSNLEPIIEDEIDEENVAFGYTENIAESYSYTDNEILAPNDAAFEVVSSNKLKKNKFKAAVNTDKNKETAKKAKKSKKNNTNSLLKQILTLLKKISKNFN